VENTRLKVAKLLHGENFELLVADIKYEPVDYFFVLAVLISIKVNVLFTEEIA